MTLSSLVARYINRLEDFDGKEVADISVNEGLFEEAFVLYKKFNENEDAVKVLINDVDEAGQPCGLNDITRALEFAQRIDDAAVWSLLAKSQLTRLMCAEAIESFCKANDPSTFQEVISVCFQQAAFEPLITYLQMARRKTKEQFIDSELIYAFAMTNRLTELEDFIAGPNVANVQQVGDRCFDEKLYEARLSPCKHLTLPL